MSNNTEMRDVIKYALQKIKDDTRLGDSVFSNPSKFKGVLGDMLPGSTNEPARNLMNIAIGVNAYARLEISTSGDMSTNVQTLANEMNRKYFIPNDVAMMAIECLAELLGYTISETNISAEQPLSQHQLSIPNQEQTQPEFMNTLIQDVNSIAFLEKGYSSTSNFAFHQESTINVVQSQKAIEPTLPDDQYQLGIRHINGDCVDKDFGQAIHWLEKAAEQGYASALFKLGECYEIGCGVEKDIKKAISLYERAAASRYPIRLDGLGMMLAKMK